MSRPLSVRVTCRVGADFGCSKSGAASRFSAGIAAWMRRVGDRADGDVHQVPGPARLVAQPGGVAARRARACSATRRRVPGAGGEGRQDLGLDPLARQGRGQPLDLPGEVGRVRPVLQGAAAAGPEVRADRRDRARRWASAPRPARAARRAPAASTRSPGRVKGTKTGPGRHAVALAADLLDGELHRRAGGPGGAAGPGAVTAARRLHGAIGVLARQRLSKMNEDERPAQKPFSLAWP